MSEILYDTSKTDNERFHAAVILSDTHKVFEDYDKTFILLEKAKDFTSKKEDLVLVHASICMVYFDLIQYDKAADEMIFFTESKLDILEPEDRAIIIMQKAFLFYLSKNNKLAKELYQKSLRIFNSVDSCHQPIVIGKMLRLYPGEAHRIERDSLYRVGVAYARICNIKKHELYLAEELDRSTPNKSIKEQHLLKKTIDSLKAIIKREENKELLNEVHSSVLDKKIKEKGQRKSLLKYLVVILFVVLIAVVFLIRRMPNENL